LRVVLLLALAVALAAVAAGCGGGDDGEEAAAPPPAADTGGAAVEPTPPPEEEAAGGTLVYATPADPTALDGALISDGESIRVLYQITEGLTRLEPGTSNVIPSLAESWEAAPDGLSWTFNLRQGVTFHDGTPFNADAVCFNFERWFNFPATFQNASASYYWQYGFGGGFKNPTEGVAGPEESLYKSCEVVDDATVTLNLTRPSATVLSALTLPSLAIVSPTALQEYGADEGSVDEDGIFHPTGTYSTEHPTGTGPFKFESWTLGEQLSIVRNDDYWGEPAQLDQVIFRPIGDNTARLQALQTGEVQGYDLVEPQDTETITGDSNLQLLERPPFNVGYVTFNQAMPPMDQLEVRQAVAHAINRQEIVDAFYAGRGIVATQFQPQEIFGWAEDVPQYEYDPEKSRQLLEQVGLTLPVAIDFWYPTDVSRDYMPDPKRNFEAMVADLEEAGFEVTPHSAPWQPDYVGAVNEGKAGHLNLIGWIADFADPDNFVGTFFQTSQPQWGFENPEIHDLLTQAEQEADQAAREELYKEANRKIMEFLPGLPYVTAKAALTFTVNVQGFVPSPVGVGGESFASVSISG
jgi:peptide/nickel transport system substrate-binding protein